MPVIAVAAALGVAYRRLGFEDAGQLYRLGLEARAWV
jgi:hypothetical protein